MTIHRRKARSLRAATPTTKDGAVAPSNATSGKLEALEDTSSGEMALNCVQRATGLS